MSTGSVDQYLPSATPGDAVTNEALALRDALRAHGPAEVYAEHVHHDLLTEVRWLDEAASPGSALNLYHASIGAPAVVDHLLGIPVPLAVRYHNITPAEFYRASYPSFATKLDGGRAELVRLADRSVLSLADSCFNALDLGEAGHQNVEVAPLVVDPARLLGVEPDPDTTNHLEATYGDDPVVLVVGQVLPHKRVELAVEALHIINTHHDPSVRGVLVGGSSIPRYVAAIDLFITQLGLHTVWATGRVPDTQLAAFYRRADVLLLTSGHEGFAVPPLEAMAHGVPVVASDHGAIAETAGDAALVLPARAGAAEFAEAALTVLGDEGLRSTMAARGRRRVARFDPSITRPALVDSLLDAARS